MQTVTKLESWFKSEEEREFTKNVIQNEIYCLGNEFQELYSKWNECWFDDVSNLFDEETGEDKEVMQWFIVSSYLADKLESIGEPVLRTDSTCLWGRTCCGQAIELDGTIQKIYRNL